MTPAPFYIEQAYWDGFTSERGYTYKSSSSKLFEYKNIIQKDIEEMIDADCILCSFICCYTTLANFSTKYLVMCKVYTDVGGIK